jgi:hypothetical protein
MCPIPKGFRDRAIHVSLYSPAGQEIFCFSWNPSSEEHATALCREPAESCPAISHCLRLIWILFSCLRLGHLRHLLPSGFPTKALYEILSPANPSSLIWVHYNCPVTRTNYESPYYDLGFVTLPKEIRSHISNESTAWNSVLCRR